MTEKTHTDEARRIAPPESYGTLCNEIAAALAAAERAGWIAGRNDIVARCKKRFPNSTFWREWGALLPAEPAAKCPTCKGSKVIEPSDTPCPACAAGGGS